MFHATGILNARWEDFSALEVAQNAGLTEVAWDCVSDDTPGTLELVVWYPHLEADIVRQRVTEIDGVEEWNVESTSYTSTEM